MLSGRLWLTKRGCEIKWILQISGPFHFLLSCLESNSDLENTVQMWPPLAQNEFLNFDLFFILMGFPGGSDSNASACNVKDPGSIPGLERSPGEGNGNPLQYSCLENSMDRGAWQATIHTVAESWTQLNDFTFTFFILPMLEHYMTMMWFLKLYC